MKKILFLILFPTILSAQGILFTAGVPHTGNTPAYTPSKTGSRLCFDTLNDQLYFWNSTSWNAFVGGASVGDKGEIDVVSTNDWRIDTGVVTAIKLNQMGATSGQVLKWNGTTWVPSNDAGGAGSAVASGIRNREVTSNSTIDTFFSTRKYDWTVPHKDSISLLPIAANDYIKVTSGAEYLVGTDSIAGFATENTAVIKKGSLYAVVQPRDGGYQVNDFGAKPDDGVTDDVPIQKAVNFVLTTNTNVKSHVVVCASGTYTINTGIVVSRRNGADYGFATIEIKGQGNAYAEGIGRATIWDCNNNDGFGLHLFRVRNTSVRGIVFQGNITNVTNQDSIFFGKPTYYLQVAGIRSNRYSPYAGIVIDGFWNGSDADAYPDFTSYYSMTSNGGSSNVILNGCAFRNFIVGVAHSIGKTVQNGDNFRLENSAGASCETFFAVGQDQTRGNSIDNIYSLYCQTFATSAKYGVGIGSMPSISNINISGACRQLVNDNSATRAQTVFFNVYAELIYSIGYSNAPNVCFTGCRFTFAAFSPSPVMHFIGDGSSSPSFYGCYLGYYGTPNRILNFSRLSAFYNCAFEGIPIGNATNTTDDGRRLLQFYNCRLIGQGGAISSINNVAKKIEGLPESNFSSQVGIPTSGIEFTPSTLNGKIICNGSLYKSHFENNRAFKYNSGNPFFVTAVQGTYRIGDAILYGNSGIIDSSITSITPGTVYLTVKSLSADTVFIEPFSYPRWLTKSDATVSITSVYFNFPILPIGCATSAGNTFLVIKDKGPLTFTGSSSAIGARLYGPGITTGTYVTGGNSDTIFISRAVQANRGYAYYKFFDHVKETSQDNTNFVFDLGDKYIVKNETTYEEYTCSTIGRYTGFQVPVFTKTYPATGITENNRTEGTGYIELPKGTTAQRPTVTTSEGGIRYNEGINGFEFIDSVKYLRLSSRQLPTVAAGAAMGSGGTVTLEAGSNDVCGVVNVTTGTGAKSGVLFTLTYRTPYTSGVLTLPFVEAYNGNTTGLVNTMFAAGTNTTFTVTLSSPGAIANTTAYSFKYFIRQ